MKSLSTILVCIIAFSIAAFAEEFPRSEVVATKQAPKSWGKKTETAAFAAGCFWGVEQEFRKTQGVLGTAVGFMGGKTPHPTYMQVSHEDTGHAETTLVVFDPKVVTYEKLLDLFWNIHDPTTLNRQGPDIGSQYRSIIFYYNASQKHLAEESLKKLQDSHELQAKIVTEITAATTFTKAEEYHQQYVEKGGRASCHYRRKPH